MATACPDEDELLAALAEHRLGEFDHLDGCEACRAAVAMLADAAVEAPVRLGHFEIVAQLGSGATSVVYLARDPRLERTVALKVIDPGIGASPLDEARALARLEHPHLVRIYDVMEVDGAVVIAMEYLPGGTLRAWMAAPRRWREVVRIAAELARGLAALHRAGVIHRDLKPDNILLDADGQARIADVGLSPVRYARGGGTPAYMAPEQRAGAASDERTDQWSLCATVHEVASGHRPSIDGEVATSIRPRRLRALLARGLAAAPAARHRSVEALADGLERLLRRRQRGAVAAGAAVVMAAMVAAAVGPAGPGDRRALAKCSDGRAEVDQVWPHLTRARLWLAFTRADLETTGALVVGAVDRYAEAWAAMYADSCAATHDRHEQSPALLDRRTGCLRERLAQLEGVVTTLATADRATLGRGPDAVVALAPVADCADLGRLDATPGPTIDPATASRRVEARLALARLRALRPLGQARVLAVKAEAVVATAEELDEPVLVAEAHLVVADALADDRQLAAADERYAATELAAERAGHDELRARALIAHATVVGAMLQEPERGGELLERGRAVATRLGRPELLRRAVVATAALAAARGDLAAAERALKAAVASWPTTGAEQVQRAQALQDLANALGEQGRHDEALLYARAAVQVIEATLGGEHVEVSEKLSVLALTLHFTGASDEARTLAERALRIKERAFGREHAALTSTIMVLALIERDAGSAARHVVARRLTDRAIALRRASLAPTHPMLLALVGERGALAVDAGDEVVARAALAEALPGLERAWGADHIGVTTSRASEAQLLAAAGDHAGCAATLATTLEAIAARANRRSPVARSLALARIRCLLDAGMIAEARTANDGLATLELDPGARVEVTLATVRLALLGGQRQRARELVASLDASVGTDLRARLDLAAAWVELGEPARAWRLIERVAADATIDLAASVTLTRAAVLAAQLGRTAEGAGFLQRANTIADAGEVGGLIRRRLACAADQLRGEQSCSRW